MFVIRTRSKCTVLHTDCVHKQTDIHDGCISCRARIAVSGEVCRSMLVDFDVFTRYSPPPLIVTIYT